MRVLSDVAAALLDRCTFPAAHPKVACAVSGGADSLALLALAIFSGCEAVAYHVDHQLRPNSADEAAIVRSACDRLGAQFFSLTVEVAPGPNLEARARSARFSVLPDDVATGHTADDQAETVLLNLLRGAGLDGLAAMTPGPRHPILAIRRCETEALVASLHLEVVHDPTNSDPAYRRNRVRHELIPLLSDIADRDVVPVLARQARIFADEAAVLDDLVGPVDLSDARALACLNAPVARRAIRRWLRSQPSYTHPVDAAAIERILAVVRGEVLACQLPGARRVTRSKGRLFLEE